MVTLKQTKGLFTGNNYCPDPSGWAIINDFFCLFEKTKKSTNKKKNK